MMPCKKMALALSKRFFSNFLVPRSIPRATGGKKIMKGEYNEDLEGQEDIFTRNNPRADNLVVPSSHFMGNVNFHETVSLLRETLDFLRSNNVTSSSHLAGPSIKFWKDSKELGSILECKLNEQQYETLSGLFTALMDYSHVPNVAELLSVFSKRKIDLYNEILDSVQVGTVDRIRKGEMYRFIKSPSSTSSSSSSSSSNLSSSCSSEQESIFYQATGSRKTARVSVLLFPNGTGEFIINNQNLHKYYESDYDSMYEIARPMLVTKTLGFFNGIITAEGGGLSGQAGAAKLAIARCIARHDSDYVPLLTKLGMLTTDVRHKERQKPGKMGARRSQTWMKR